MSKLANRPCDGNDGNDGSQSTSAVGVGHNADRASARPNAA